MYSSHKVRAMKFYLIIIIVTIYIYYVKLDGSSPIMMLLSLLQDAMMDCLGWNITYE